MRLLSTERPQEGRRPPNNGNKQHREPVQQLSLEQQRDTVVV